MVVHTCNSSTQEDEAGDQPLLHSKTLSQKQQQKAQPGVIGHTCNPSTGGVWGGFLQFKGRLDYTARPDLKNETKWGTVLLHCLRLYKHLLTSTQTLICLSQQMGIVY
jgi:hypothetical protein